MGLSVTLSCGTDVHMARLQLIAIAMHHGTVLTCLSSCCDDITFSSALVTETTIACMPIAVMRSQADARLNFCSCRQLIESKVESDAHLKRHDC